MTTRLKIKHATKLELKLTELARTKSKHNYTDKRYKAENKYIDKRYCDTIVRTKCSVLKNCPHYVYLQFPEKSL